MKTFAFLSLFLASAVFLSAKVELSETSLDALGGFDYDPEAPEEDAVMVREDKAYLESVVPAEVMELDKKSISITGYMLPLDSEGHLVREFLLVPNTQACCYGVMPAPNQFIYVQMDGQGTLVLDNIPVTVQGRLTIAETWDQGFFSHLYHIKGSRVEVGKFN